MGTRLFAPRPIGLRRMRSEISLVRSIMRSSAHSIWLYSGKPARRHDPSKRACGAQGTLQASRDDQAEPARHVSRPRVNLAGRAGRTRPAILAPASVQLLPRDSKWTEKAPLESTFGKFPRCSPRAYREMPASLRPYESSDIAKVFGSGGRDRTYDQLINSQLLYR